MYKEKWEGNKKYTYFLRTFYFQILLTFSSSISVWPIKLQEEHQKINIEKFILSGNGVCKLGPSSCRGYGLLHFTHEISIEDYIFNIKKILLSF